MRGKRDLQRERKDKVLRKEKGEIERRKEKGERRESGPSFGTDCCLRPGAALCLTGRKG